MSKRKRTLPRGWYPVDGKDCRREIESYVEGWSPPDAIRGTGLGGVVPHAGWYFSGRLAARVFASLQSDRKIDGVVLFGGHMGPGDPPRGMMEDTLETPLGEIEVHRDLLEEVMKRTDLQKESASSGDNTIEIQLTMIRYFLPGVKLLALRPPFSEKAITLGRMIAEIALKKNLQLVAIGSTDLTHYGPNYGNSPRGVGPASVEWVKQVNDKGFIDRAINMDPKGLLDHAMKHDSACSAGAVASTIAVCETLGASRGTLVDYYTSYDIMPDHSFVGYAGIVYL